MHFATAIACLAGSALAAPSFTYPSSGFPHIAATDPQVPQIENTAGGTLPNGGPPESISIDGITSLQLIATNELFEVAFFTELLNNVTSGVYGYEVPKVWAKDVVVGLLERVIAQEQLHALFANTVLSATGTAEIQPCTYNFPVTNFAEAIALANTFTDVVLGTLGDINFNYATNGDSELIPGTSSVIAQEGEQNGLYRLLQAKAPSAAPFLTGGSRDFAFTAINSFIVPGSCDLSAIPLTIFPALTLNNATVPPEECTLEFSWVKADGKTKPTNIVYISGQNVPVVETFDVVSQTDGIITVTAPFPFKIGGGSFNDGVILVAATDSAGPFKNAEDVAKSAIFAPALIEVEFQ